MIKVMAAAAGLLVAFASLRQLLRGDRRGLRSRRHLQALTGPHECVREWDWRDEVNPHYASYALDMDVDFNVTMPAPSCGSATPEAVVCEIWRFNVKQKVRNEW